MNGEYSYSLHQCTWLLYLPLTRRLPLLFVLLVNLMCLTRHHTRAYIHHLLVAHELLGEVLLYRHNQHQVLLLFSRAREVLQSAHTHIAQPDTVDVEIEEADGNSNSEGGSGGGDDYGGNGDNGGDDDSSLVGACGRQLSEESLFLSKQLSDEVEWASADLTGEWGHICMHCSYVNVPVMTGRRDRKLKNSESRVCV